MVSLNPLNWFKKGPSDEQLQDDVNYAISGIPALNNVVGQLTGALTDPKTSKGERAKAEAALRQIHHDMEALVRQSYALGDKEVPDQGVISKTFSAMGTAFKSAFPTAALVATAAMGVKIGGDKLGLGQMVGTRLSDKERESKLLGAENAAVIKFLEEKDPTLKTMEKTARATAIATRQADPALTAALADVRATARSQTEAEIKEVEGSPVKAGMRQGFGLGALALVINTLTGTFFGAGKQAAEQEHEALKQVHALLRQRRGGAQAAPQVTYNAGYDSEFIGPGGIPGLGGRQLEEGLG